MLQMFPPLGLVRYPVRFYLFTAFAVACLAGFGLDFLGRKRSGRWTLLIIAAAMIELTLVNATERPIPMDAYLKPSPNLEAVMRDGGICAAIVRLVHGTPSGLPKRLFKSCLQPPLGNSPTVNAL